MPNIFEEINKAFEQIEEKQITKEQEAKAKDCHLKLNIYGKKKHKKKKPKSEFIKEYNEWVKRKKLLVPLKLNHLDGNTEQANSEIIELTKGITESFFISTNPIVSKYLWENKKDLELFFRDMLEETRQSHYSIIDKEKKFEAVRFDYSLKIGYLKECYSKGVYEKIPLDSSNWKRIGTAFFQRFELNPKERQPVSLLVSNYSLLALDLPQKQELLECQKQQQLLPPD